MGVDGIIRKYKTVFSLEGISNKYSEAKGSYL